MRQSRTSFKTIRPSRPLRLNPRAGATGQGADADRQYGQTHVSAQSAPTYGQLSDENHRLRCLVIELEKSLLDRRAGALVYDLRAKYHI